MAFKFTVSSREGERTLVLEELAEFETEGREFLGEGYGVNVEHCAFMGAKYCEGFLGRVRGYRIFHGFDETLEALRTAQPGAIRVDFYG